MGRGDGFRSDIEGLRALAVLPVVLAHVDVALLRGGFVGVDVFFVISGYLITAILTRELEAGRFSLWRFFRRRVQRILPALLVVLVVGLAAGWWLLLPADDRELGFATAAAAGFSANVWFWLTTNYFQPGGTAVLLHTWSLAVEEQFYLLFPLLLLFTRSRLRGRYDLLLWAIFGSSLIFSLGMGQAHPTSAFYLLPGRAWELAIGGLLAVRALPLPAGDRGRSAGSLLGVVLIVGSCLLAQPGPGVPAPISLAAAIGAVLVLHGKPHLLAGRLLSIAPVRWLGRVSYSLYLWHWPVVAFWKLETGVTLDRADKLTVIGLSLVLAAVSYIAVERPFMRIRSGSDRGVVLTGVGALAAVVALGLAYAAWAPGLRRLPPDVAHAAAFLDYPHTPAFAAQFRAGLCFNDERGPAAECLRPASDQPNILVLGDSYAAHLWRAVALRHPEARVLQATVPRCRATLEPVGNEACVALTRRALGPMTRDGRIGQVILAGRWTEDDVEAVSRTVRHLRAKGVAVTVAGPSVEMDGETPRFLARALRWRDPDSLSGLLRPDRLALDRRLGPAVEAAGGRYWSLHEAECPAGRCPPLTPSGEPWRFDFGHYTQAGANAVIAKVDPRQPAG